MTTDQIDLRVTERSWFPNKGRGGFGFDFFVRTSQQGDANENRAALGVHFWGGRASTLFWVDPVNNPTAILLVQVIPFDGTLPLSSLCGRKPTVWKRTKAARSGADCRRATGMSAGGESRPSPPKGANHGFAPICTMPSPLQDDRDPMDK